MSSSIYHRVFFNEGIIEGQTKTISDLREKINAATNHDAKFTEQGQTIIDMQRSIDLLEEKVINLEIRNKKLSSGLSQMKGPYFNLSRLFTEKKAK
jgi:predicted RNase H-like nuclease (RuvC/YqgF family)